MTQISAFDVWNEITGHWRPRANKGCALWMSQNVRMPDGRPWDLEMYPHIAAPGGPCEAFDNPYVREIVLQWGTRLGKTAFGLSLQLFIADMIPAPMVLGSSTDLVAKRIIERLYTMYGKCNRLKHQMRPPHRRRRDLVLFRDCRTHVAWSGSVSTLADLSAWFVHVNEVDKHSTEESVEGDSVSLLLKRNTEFPTRKSLIEGTPTVKGRSRIERFMAGSTYRRYWVPCPLCGAYQVLRLGMKDQPGGITWDKMENGHSSPLQAYKSARYVCQHCEGELFDQHRPMMMRNGVWIPRDCVAGRNGEIVGEWEENPREGYQLASIYSLGFGWGDIAMMHLNAKTSAERQDFVNSTLAQVWSRVNFETTWQKLGKRLTVLENRQGTVPVGGCFLVQGIDVQRDHYVPFVMACGENGQKWLVDWSVVHTDQELDEWMDRTYPREDGGQPMTPRLTGIDSGDRTDEVYRLCRRLHAPERGRSVLPVKGIKAGDMGGQPYAQAKLDDDRKGVQHAGLKNIQLVKHNRAYWEVVVQDALEVLQPGDPFSLSLPAEALNDQDLLEQLLNAAEVDGKWQKAEEDKPDDFRAAFRYAMTMAEMVVRRRWTSIRYTSPTSSETASTAPSRQKPTPPSKPLPSKGWLSRPGLR
jgi:phage terminase large subunit GpA-like protein